jgi:hypothetical protein
MRTRPAVLNTVVVLASLAIAVLVCEAAARLVLNPADYLSVTTVPDDVLGIRIAPGTRGFDQWGFRNRSVPGAADIVAVGDSHTYGNAATMADAWPAVVAAVTGRTVYNLGLGGYGPNQYYHLLKTRAVTLRPRWVAVGLYMGDDLENAFLMTYGLDHWKFLRNGHWTRADANIWETAHDLTPLQRVRLWFSRHSVLYQVVVHGPVLGRLKGAVQVARAARGEDRGTTSLVDADAGIQEAFRPLGIRDRLDQRSPAVREGLRITLELLALMDRTCREHGCRLVVVLIPTKETVFAEHLLRAERLPLREAIAELVAHEAQASGRIRAFLDERGIPSVETLSALRRHLGRQLYARSDRDMHPSGNGYRVIGEAVAAFFRGASHAGP